jgi:hypothetical protein
MRTKWARLAEASWRFFSDDSEAMTKALVWMQ